MKLTFFGTRGGIKARSPLHYMHSSLFISFAQNSLLIDWGEDWVTKTPPSLDGLLITHAHPDHADGLAQGFPAPVYATHDTWQRIHRFPINEKRLVKSGESFSIGHFCIEPFEVYHSIRAPAVGYRIHAGQKSLFYAPDLVAIIDEKKALEGIDAYIGDGALISRKILMRITQGTPVGHIPIREQLAWCKRNSVPQAFFTHCGSEIVKGKLSAIEEKITQVARSTGVETHVAYDGLTLEL